MTSSLDKVFPRLHVFGNTSYNTAEFPELILREQSCQQDYLYPTIQHFLIDLLESPELSKVRGNTSLVPCVTSCSVANSHKPDWNFQQNQLVDNKESMNKKGNIAYTTS